jgi:hypothetical protein
MQLDQGNDAHSLSIRETMLSSRSSRSVAVNRVPRGTHMYGVASAPWPSVPY